jgi:hypothetical protein
MANKKINQLVSKTAILSTDLFGIGDATTGQLFKKTIAELQAAIGGAVISVNGLVGTVVLDTDDIQELATPTNKYFTDARARGAISLTVTGNSGASTYSSGTGVLNVPTYTLAGLGGISATFLSGTSGISYNSGTGVISYSGTVYTDASIRALFSGGTGITYNSSTGAISYSGTVYTDSSVRALISMTTTGTSGASTYNNTTGVINVPNYTLAGLGGISLTSLSGGTGITYNNTTGAISYSGTVYTDASIRGLISLTTTGTSGASTYNSTTGVLNIPQYQGAITLTTTGTSGAATFSTNTLNIPQYQAVLTNPITGTGTTNYVTKFTSSTVIGNSLIFDNGTRVGINTASITNTILTIYDGSANGDILKLDTASTKSDIWFNDSVTTNGAIRIRGEANGLKFITGSTINFTIASTGDATFSSSVRANAASTIYGATQDAIQTILTIGGQNASAQAKELYIRLTAGSTPQWTLQTASVGNDADINIYPNGTSGLKISYTAGAATFSSSVTASGNIRLLGDSYVFGTSAADSTVLRAGIRFNSTSQELKFFTSDAGRVIITSAGLMGIGTDSPATLLHVYSSSQGVSRFESTQGEVNIALNNSSASGNLLGAVGSNIYIYSAGSEKLRVVGSSGNLLLGTTSDNGERLYVSGAIRATGTITANSDLTLKKNLLKIENALEKVEQINGYTYEFKQDDSRRHAGVIAQEIQTVLPEIVNKGNDGILGVEYGNISALLIEAIKEQNTKIKNLETLLASK